MHIRVGTANPVADYINGLMHIKNCNLAELADITGIGLSTLYRLTCKNNNSRSGNIKSLSMLVHKTGIDCHIVAYKEV